MEDEIKPAFLDAENVAFIDAKNARIDAQRKVIEELVDSLNGLFRIVQAFGYTTKLSKSHIDRLDRASAAIAKAKELTK